MSPPPEEKEPEKPKVAFQKKVDLDWKRKIQLEKERLAAPAAGEPSGTAPPKTEKTEKAPPPEPASRAATNMGFLALVQQMADQSALFMGLVPGYPERNCEQALASIEMLRALQEKTKGNLSAQESKALTGIVYELQMRYVETCGGGPA